MIRFLTCNPAQFKCDFHVGTKVTTSLLIVCPYIDAFPLIPSPVSRNNPIGEHHKDVDINNEEDQGLQEEVHEGCVDAPNDQIMEGEVERLPKRSKEVNQSRKTSSGAVRWRDAQLLRRLAFLREQELPSLK